MDVIFDTNTVYYLDSKLSNSEFEIIKQKVKRKELYVFISPITVIEMTSRLKTNPKDFLKVQNAVKKLFLLDPIFLPDQEQQLIEYIETNKNKGYDLKSWRDIFETIKIAPSITKLESGFNEFSTMTVRSVNVNRISLLRDEYEKNYVSDMTNHLKRIIPDYEFKITKGKSIRLPKDKVDDFKQFLNSSIWLELFKFLLISKTRLPLPSNTTDIFEKIHFFKKSYENLLLKIVENGYIPNMKKKNDYNDCHFNVYFNNDNNFIFITSESNVVFDELKIKNRCKDLMELVR